MQEKHYKLFKDPTWGTMAGMNVNISFAQPSVTPGISMPTTSSNFVFHAKTGGEAFGFHGNVFVEGYVNSQEIKGSRPGSKTSGLWLYLLFRCQQ